MKWEGERQSDNVEDRRGLTVGRGAVGGGAIILAIVAALLGAPAGTVREILGGGSPSSAPSSQARRQLSPTEVKEGDFARRLLGSTEDTWSTVFRARGGRYVPPALVLF